MPDYKQSVENYIGELLKAIDETVNVLINTHDDLGQKSLNHQIEADNLLDKAKPFRPERALSPEKIQELKILAERPVCKPSDDRGDDFYNGGVCAETQLAREILDSMNVPYEVGSSDA